MAQTIGFINGLSFFLFKKKTMQQKEIDKLRERFANKYNEMVEKLEGSKKNGKDISKQEHFMESVISYVKALEIKAETTKYVQHHTHQTIQGGNMQANEYNPYQSNNFLTVLQNNQTTNTYSGDWIYRIGKDLIISTNGQFIFQPVSKKLYTMVGQIELSEQESKELLRVLTQDFNLRDYGKI